MAPGQTEATREKPPACELPSAEEVASSCAVHDLVTSPGYEPPTYDEQVVRTSHQAAPEYRVSELRCDFTTGRRNQALCRFKLSLADGQGTSTEAAVVFEHLFWQDHGPAHHFYGTRWSPTGRCARGSLS